MQAVIAGESVSLQTMTTDDAPRPRPVKVVSEAAREREAFKYEPRLINSFPVNQTAQSKSDATLKTSSDSVLTALAQLGLYQTGTDHAFISLFDVEHQCIVAEATLSTPLAPNLPSQECPSPLLLCGHAIPRSHGVCEHVLHETGHESLDPSELPVALVSQLSADSRFSDKPYCQPDQPLQFYAAVPIRSPRGINIGVYSVWSGRKDIVWSEKASCSLRDISKAIMDHMEGNRAKDAHRRSERVARGLGSVIEGKSTLSGWKQGPNAAAFENTSKLEGRLDSTQQHLDSQADALAENNLYDRESTISHAAPIDLPHRPHDTPNGAADDTVDGKFGASTSSFFEATRKARFEQADRPNKAVETVLDDESDIGERRKSLLFSKASNIIREAFEVEGCAFFDVTVGSYRTPIARAKPDKTEQPPMTSSSDEQLPTSPMENPDASCGILGFATSVNSSINSSRVGQHEWHLPKRFLAKLLRRYPDGKIFNFDAAGELQSGDSSEGDRSAAISADDGSLSTVSAETVPADPTATTGKPRPRDKRTRRLLEGSVIYETFRAARSVIFVPMWDSKRERWFAGGFAYTYTPSRVFTVEGELSLLKAFTQVMAAEFYSIDTSQTNQARSDALGSLSHELRSPLHGVILATELLNDTDLTVFQGNATHTIETCCRTLLDTLDHLLDYAKINSFAMRRKDKNNLTSPALRRRADTSDFGKQRLYSIVRLDGLVEEVVESVFAGFNFQRMSVQQMSRAQSALMQSQADSHNKMDTAQAMEQLTTPVADEGHDKVIGLEIGSVAVYLQVDPTVNWTFQLPSGAIRRIVMNIFGNSLKFTSHGFICISLSQDRPSTKRPRAKRIVKIVVQDTGKGMTEDYIRHRLFRPFAQEDEFSSGTGLGLSLVKKIVTSLQGQILVESELNSGTKITVNLPLERAVSTDDKTNDDAAFEEQVEELRGLRVCLNGFAREGHKRNIVADTCRDALRVAVIAEEQREQLRADVIVWSDDALPDSMEDLSAYVVAPNVVICQDALEAYRLANSFESAGHVGAFEFISQPIGPRKLAKSIHSCYNRWMGLRNLPSKQAGSPASWSTPSLAGEKKSPSPMQSSAPTNGSIPRSHPASRTETQQDLVDPNQAEATERMLLVDDNNINLKVLSAFMGKLGRPYEVAVNGQQALETYTQSPGSFAGVLMDISMPVMDGFEATRQIRQFEHQHELAATPIVALTGLASHTAQQEALESGVNLFLTKPVRFNTLSEALASLKI